MTVGLQLGRTGKNRVDVLLAISLAVVLGIGLVVGRHVLYLNTEGGHTELSAGVS